MRRICINFNGAERWTNNPKVKWIICKECKREELRKRQKFNEEVKENR